MSSKFSISLFSIPLLAFQSDEIKTWLPRNLLCLVLSCSRQTFLVFIP